ncbi:hypothetical protein L0N33_20050, partial [Roseburia faecis]|nr:hypothetical protein [Roseburia faecis]
RLLNDLVSIMTWSIASRQALQLSLAMRIAAQHRGIVAHLGNWRQTGQQNAVSCLITKRVNLAMHPLQIVKRATNLSTWNY